MTTSTVAASALILASPAVARIFTVYNSRHIVSLLGFFFPNDTDYQTTPLVYRLSFTIWPALFTDLNVGGATPNQPTGWVQNAYQSVSFTVPNNWIAGHIWGRRNCNFSTNPGPNSCLDGSCKGRLLRDPHTGTGVPLRRS
ncbi:hypothetical protein FRB95_011719 [Tulasnella sp. JGI-2019a]|nr:hypothetical protein FRB95_011719 [Tulasnella sp. JGI-2019a]